MTMVIIEMMMIMMLQELLVKERERVEEISRLKNEAASRIKDLEQEVRTRDGKLKGHRY